MINNFKDEIRSLLKKVLITIIKSFDTIVFVATKSSSVALSVTGIGLLVIPL